jgi:hypothetical protein
LAVTSPALVFKEAPQREQKAAPSSGISASQEGHRIAADPKGVSQA